MAWTWNNDYKDLGQVEEFYPAYLARYEALRAAGRYPYNDDFKGHIPGIESREDTAIYMLQTLRSLKETETMLAERRAAGWRDFDRAEVDAGPVRFAGVIEYAIYHTGSHATGSTANGTGWREWEGPRLTCYHSSLMLLPGRNRSNGDLIHGRVLVKD